MTDTPVKETAEKPAARKAKASSSENGQGDYVTPITHTHVPRRVVDGAFWGGLAGAVVLGVIDPPLGVLLGAGVVVARHRSNGKAS